MPLSKTGVELLFEVFSRRYERKRHAGRQQLAIQRMGAALAGVIYPAVAAEPEPIRAAAKAS